MIARYQEAEDYVSRLQKQIHECREATRQRKVLEQSPNRGVFIRAIKAEQEAAERLEALMPS